MQLTDRFKTFTLFFPTLILGIFILMLAIYFLTSVPIFQREGLDIYTTNTWQAAEQPQNEKYGVLAAIFGSLYTSILAVLVSLPLAICYSVFVIDYAPGRLKEWFIITTDIMAGLPTILYGIWGAFYLVPFLKNYVMYPLYNYLSFIPLFSYEPLTGYSFLSAGILLGIMVTPFSASVIREAYRMVPFRYREAVFSVGATNYEATKILLGYIKTAIVAGVILAFGRAIGETVAVSLVVGNAFNIHPSLFTPGYTVSSLIANQFGNAFIYEYMVSALFAAGLSIFLIGLAVNILAIYILRRGTHAY